MSSSQTVITDRPKITATYVSRYIALEEKKRQLDVQGRNLGKLLGVMKSEMLDHVKAETGRKSIKTIRIGGFELAIDQKPASVSWSKEFVKYCGAALADKLRRAAKKVDVLKVKPVTPNALRVQETAAEQAREAAEQAAAA